MCEPSDTEWETLPTADEDVNLSRMMIKIN